jgi:hypothetical protein
MKKTYLKCVEAIVKIQKQDFLERYPSKKAKIEDITKNYITNYYNYRYLTNKKISDGASDVFLEAVCLIASLEDKYKKDELDQLDYHFINEVANSYILNFCTFQDSELDVKETINRNKMIGNIKPERLKTENVEAYQKLKEKFNLKIDNKEMFFDIYDFFELRTNLQQRYCSVCLMKSSIHLKNPSKGKLYNK